MTKTSLTEMQLQRRAFGQYLNYLVNLKAKGVKTIGLDEIPIDREIKVVADRIKDNIEMISRANSIIDHVNFRHDKH